MSVLAAARSRHSFHIHSPSPLDRSSARPDTMLRDQSLGVATHSAGAKNTGSVIATQPIIRLRPSPRSSVPPRRSSLRSNSCSSCVPLACPNTSQARQAGSRSARANRPNPPIAWCGRLSLKKNGAPGGSARNAVPAGRQNFTSVISGCARRNWYQPWSVGATKPCTDQSWPVGRVDAGSESLPTPVGAGVDALRIGG